MSVSKSTDVNEADMESGSPSNDLGKQEQPVEKLSLLAWLLKHWESAALCSVVLAILSLLAFVLWPAPSTVLTLHEMPLAVHSLPTVSQTSEDASTASELTEDPQEALSTTAESSTVKRITHAHTRHFTAKKPKHPPITNLNTANLAQLQLLPGLGPKMAQRVLEYRHSHGPFTDLSQIMDVKGIGPKKFEKMHPFIKL